MPPSNSVGHGTALDDNSHADGATVDTSTLLQKPSTTPDGKSVEALMQRRLEIDRQLQALENETMDAGSASGSLEDRISNSRLQESSSSQPPSNYRPAMPAPQSPEYQYPGPLPTTDESVEHSYPPMQAPMHPLGSNGGHNMFAPHRPNQLSSSVSVGSANSGSNHRPGDNFSTASSMKYPFANPYDPQFLAAAVTAFHHQQQFQHQQHATVATTQQPQMVQNEGRDDIKNDKMLWKLLNDKEEELKEVRQTLRETEKKFQEQSLLATKLQTTLDQVQEAFEKERLLIKLQAEKEAQEAMFQKQVVWMEKHAITKKETEQPTNADTKAAINSVPSKIDVKTSGDDPKPQKGDFATSKSPKKTVDPHNYVWNNNNTTKKSPDKQTNGLKKTISDDNDKLLAIAKSSSEGIQLYPSIDESYSGGNKNGESNQSSKLPPKPTTPVPEAPMANNLSQTNHTMNASVSSDRFDPVYVAPKTDKEENKEQVYSPNDDDGSLGQTVASSTYGDDRVKVTNKTLLDPYGDKGTYTGVVLRNTGMPHGLGRMVYEEDRRVFEGDWRHGRWHGYGRASFSNGDSYEGQYKFDQRHGNGIYRWNDGRVYNGQFSEDKRHGKGVFTWPDGAVYDGDFVNGQRQGHGMYTFADGGQYEGSWKDGRYDGFGTCTWEDGRRYRGEWRNGMAHGRGTETYPNGNIRHEGEWVDDEPIR